MGRADRPPAARRGRVAPDAAHETGPPDEGRARETDPLAVFVQQRARKRQLLRLPRVMWRAIRLVHESARRPFYATAALQLVNALLLGAQVLLAKRGLDAVVRAQNGEAGVRDVFVPLLLLSVVGAAATALTAVNTQIQRLVSELTMRRSLSDMLGVTQAVDLLEFEESDFYDHLQRVELNAAHRPVVVTQAVLALVGGVAGAVVVLIVLVTLNPILIPLLAVAAVPVYVASRVATAWEFKFAVRQTPKYRRRLYLRELLSRRDSAKEVRAFQLGPHLRAQYDALYGGYIEDLHSLVRRRVGLAVVANLLAGSLTAAALLVLVHLLVSGSLTLAEATAAAVAMRVLAGRISALLGGIGDLLESSLFLDDLDGFAARRPANGPERPARAQAAPTRICCESVTFSYPGAARPALEDVDLDVARGQVVALVGENGSGKTTLAKILAGLYAPSSGRMLWDGFDMASSPSVVRENTAVIFQDFVRYKMSAQENIVVGRPDRWDDRDGAIAALRSAAAWPMVERLPETLNTVLSREFSGGVDLSGGQWQRIALARAFFRDAPIVILDEPTAALDARAEYELFEDLRTLLTGRTVFLISHRFANVKSADVILVMKEGRIVERGDHSTLMRMGGAYSELYTLQSQGYAEI